MNKIIKVSGATIYLTGHRWKFLSDFHVVGEIALSDSVIVRFRYETARYYQENLGDTVFISGDDF